MKSKNLKGIPPAIVVPNFLTKKECAKFIQLGKTSVRKKEEFGADDGRYSYYSVVTPCQDVPTYLKIQRKLHELNSKVFKFDLHKEIGEASFLEYTKGGFTGWHHDGTIGEEYPDRKLTAVIMLTEQGVDYEGGNFNLPHYTQLDAKQRADMSKVGTLILFPSFEFHEVSKVKKGLRYTLAYFMKGPRFK